VGRSKLSPQAGRVLNALARDPESWQHGYDLLRLTGLKSGSLYPILMRLTERGWLEAIWEPDPPFGRPRRHLYRLTAEGVRAARDAPAIAVRALPRARAARSVG
jgi:DNA-binding PadR family transcriptional regulator